VQHDVDDAIPARIERAETVVKGEAEIHEWPATRRQILRRAKRPWALGIAPQRPKPADRHILDNADRIVASERRVDRPAVHDPHRADQERSGDQFGLPATGSGALQLLGSAQHQQKTPEAFSASGLTCLESLRLETFAEPTPYGLRGAPLLAALIPIITILPTLPTLPVLTGAGLDRAICTEKRLGKWCSSTFAVNYTKIAGVRRGVKLWGDGSRWKWPGKIRRWPTNKPPKMCSSQGGKAYAWRIQDAGIRVDGSTAKSRCVFLFSFPESCISNRESIFSRGSTMSVIFLLVGVSLAAALVFGGFQTQLQQVRIASLVAAVVVLFAAFTLASFRYVGENSLGVVTKNIGFKSLPPGKIVATAGEMGPQAATLPPGWHPWYWPFIYDIDVVQLTMIPEGQIGLLSAADGQPLPADTTYAPEWSQETKGDMAQNAEFFLSQGGGFKGPQSSVLAPGKYRINPKLFTVEIVPATTIDRAMVGVVKSNVGAPPAAPTVQLEAGADVDSNKLVDKGNRGIWRDPILPGQSYLNTKAYEVTKISTRTHVVRYTVSQGQHLGIDEESEIMVRTSDGFTFPVDVRLEFSIQPQDAPLVVAIFGDDQEGMRAVMNSEVRGIFRNNAEDVKALDYVKQRSIQESQSLEMLQAALSKKGISVSAVRIGDVGDEKSLGTLLKTQTAREIALQEQMTFQEQQRAAEQKKLLTKTEQEAEEEKRLATASYEVKIAEQEQKQKIIEAEAEAQSIKIKALAQADAYQQIAAQIGSSNAALIEVLKIVGERGIEITPRVMVSGGANGGSQTTALIGTMLDTMVDRTPAPPASAPRQTPR
jgi:uncharacterized membrane protein YqiK